MRLTRWFLGILLGAIAGGLALEVGGLVLLLAVPCLVWAARESARPVGLAGLLVGVGVGGGGLLALADASCAAFNSATTYSVRSCISPDVTPYLVVALVFTAIGASLTVVGIRRTSPGN